MIDQPKNLLSPKAAAKLIGVSKSLIYRWISDERRLPHYRLGGQGRRGKILIDPDDLQNFLRENRVEKDEGDEDEPLRHLR
jgi:excisionase family DNA binding protein